MNQTSSADLETASGGTEDQLWESDITVLPAVVAVEYCVEDDMMWMMTEDAVAASSIGPFVADGESSGDDDMERVDDGGEG